jgi:hypothetical protein
VSKSLRSRISRIEIPHATQIPSRERGQDDKRS